MRICYKSGLHVSCMTTFDLVIGLLVPTLWVTWLVYWWLSARNVKPTRSRESLWAELRHRGPLMLAALLLAAGSAVAQLPA